MAQLTLTISCRKRWFFWPAWFVMLAFAMTIGRFLREERRDRIAGAFVRWLGNHAFVFEVGNG